MFRQLLTYGFTVVALGCGLCVVPAPVHSQDRSTAERLDRLERDLNMLQRQVYRGMPAPPIGAGGGALVNTQIRMDRLEEQMRNLTGRVEELSNEIAQVRQRIEQVNSDAGMRVGQGTGASGPLPLSDVAPSPGSPTAARPSRRFPPPPPDATEEEIPPRLAGPAAPPPGDAVNDGPTPIFGTLSPPGVPALLPPPPAGQLAPASTASAGRTLGAAKSEGSPSAQYNHAFGLLKQADYAGAETALKAFVEQHPNDPMAGNAQYWLGETYYARGHYIDAASAFAEGYKRYPKSGKAADGLLKLGMALGRANQKQNACVVLARLDHDFPHAGTAVKQHAAAERKHLGC
jgi:tol-pal system protein YbgF